MLFAHLEMRQTSRNENMFLAFRVNYSILFPSALHRMKKRRAASFQPAICFPEIREKKISLYEHSEAHTIQPAIPNSFPHSAHIISLALLELLTKVPTTTYHIPLASSTGQLNSSRVPTADPPGQTPRTAGSARTCSQTQHTTRKHKHTHTHTQTPTATRPQRASRLPPFAPPSDSGSAQPRNWTHSERTPDPRAFF